MHHTQINIFCFVAVSEGNYAYIRTYTSTRTHHAHAPTHTHTPRTRTYAHHATGVTFIYVVAFIGGLWVASLTALILIRQLKENIAVIITEKVENLLLTDKLLLLILDYNLISGLTSYEHLWYCSEINNFFVRRKLKNIANRYQSEAAQHKCG